MSSAQPQSATTTSSRRVKLPDNFKLTESGLFYTPSKSGSDGEAPKPIWICSSIHVTARTRNSANEDHGRLLEFEDADGVHHEWAMPMEMLAGDGTDYRRILLSKGLHIAPAREARGLLTLYIQSSRPEARALCVQRTGWHENVYVFPDETIGQHASDERVLLQTASFETNTFTVSGDLNGWRATVGAWCVGNSRLAFAVSCAFAAPLLHLLSDESGGFNLQGPSSIGKTTAIIAAGSVFGGKDYMRGWRTTANGLEGVATQHNDALLVLDELAQVTPQEAGEAAYMLANGAGKTRARRDGTARKQSTWRIIFLSSGEVGLATHMQAGGKKSSAGQEVRLVDIPADAEVGLGIFEDLHKHKDGAEFANAINEATRAYHGTAGRAFIRSLVTDDAKEVANTIRTFQRDFISEVVLDNPDGQVIRVAKRFALVAAAGELATIKGLTGWPEGTAIDAARVCFDAWIKKRGGFGQKEIEAALSQVRYFFEVHGESRFTPWDGDEDRRTINRAGFRRDTNDGVEFYVFPEVFTREICEGLEPKFVADLLVKRGLVIPGSDGNTSVHRPAGMKKSQRFYHFAPTVIGG